MLKEIKPLKANENVNNFYFTEFIILYSIVNQQVQKYSAVRLTGYS